MKIYEIFHSIQGESTFQGLPCTFVRLSGCNLRCAWCDSAYAFFGGEEMSIDEVVKKVNDIDLHLVLITGGEPLMQKECLELMTRLSDESHTVLLETSGSIDTIDVDPRVKKIIDFKTPSSLMVEENDWNNVNRLQHGDEIKFVIADKADYSWSVEKLKEYDLEDKTIVNFSPVHGKMDAKELTEWILKDNIDVRLNLQLHKYIWDEHTTGV